MAGNKFLTLKFFTWFLLHKNVLNAEVSDTTGDATCTNVRQQKIIQLQQYAREMKNVFVKNNWKQQPKLL